MSNVGVMETLKKYQNEMLEIKNTVTEMTNTFDRLMKRLAKEIIRELEGMLTNFPN